MLIDYLVTSVSRKTLLRILWVNGESGSVLHLARLAELSFSTAYEELKHMEQVGLARSVHIKNAVLYRANKEHPQAHLLELLLGEKSDRYGSLSGLEKDSDQVVADLVQLGAPLSTQSEPDPKSSPEETLASALKLARYNPAVARVLPLVVAKNMDHLDFVRLKALAVRVGERRTLGFFLDVAATLTRDQKLKREAEDLVDRRVKRTECFFVKSMLDKKPGTFMRRLEVRNTPKLARKWHFTMNMGFDSFESLYRKFI